MALFFFFQLIAHISLFIGERLSEDKGAVWYSKSRYLFPPDPEPQYKYAISLMRKGSDDPEKISRSINSFKKVLTRNVLYYQAYFNIGRAIWALGETDTDSHVDVKDWFKRTTFIRSNNPVISVEVLKYMLSLWPFLNEPDRHYSRSLLKKSINFMETGDFFAILEIWGLYCREVDFLEPALNCKPRFYKPVADHLSRLEIEHSRRQYLSVRHEKFYLDNFDDVTRYVDANATDASQRLITKYNLLQENIPGYHLLLNDENFNKELFRKVKKETNLKVIDSLLKRKVSGKKTVQNETPEKYIFYYLRDFCQKKDVNELLSFLDRRNYFDGQDLGSKFVFLSLLFSRGEFEGVIDHAQRLLGHYSFFKSDQMENYLKILLLVADSHIQRQEWEKAFSLLKQAEQISHTDSDVYWLWAKLGHQGPDGFMDRVAYNGTDIESMGAAEEGLNTGELARRAGFEQIKTSRFIRLTADRFRNKIYLLDEDTLIFRFSHRLFDQLKSKHLMQVLVDGKIVFEEYARRLGETVEVPSGLTWCKPEVVVKID